VQQPLRKQNPTTRIQYTDGSAIATTERCQECSVKEALWRAFSAASSFPSPRSKAGAGCLALISPSRLVTVADPTELPPLEVQKLRGVRSAARESGGFKSPSALG
jgi:hypothetical protein